MTFASVNLTFCLIKAERKASEQRLGEEQSKLDEAVRAARNAGDVKREAKELEKQLQKLQVGILKLTITLEQPPYDASISMLFWLGILEQQQQNTIF